MRLIIFLLITNSIVCAQPITYPSQDNEKRAIDSLAIQGSTFPRINNLTKIGINLPLLRQSSFTPYWIAVGLDVTTERKILKALSLIGSLETNINFSRGAQLYNIELPLGLRYYFSLGKKMRSRPEPHGFFSHYLSVQTHNTLLSMLNYNTDGSKGPRTDLQKYNRGVIDNQITNNGTINESTNFINYIFLQVGSQIRLIGNRYVDVNIAVPFPIYNKYAYTLTTPALINLRYGIIWQ